MEKRWSLKSVEDGDEWLGCRLKGERQKHDWMRMSRLRAGTEGAEWNDEMRGRAEQAKQAKQAKASAWTLQLKCSGGKSQGKVSEAS